MTISHRQILAEAARLRHSPSRRGVFKLGLAALAVGTCASMACASLAWAQTAVLTITAPQLVDLRSINMVIFELEAAGTITSYANVVPGKLYVFYFPNENTTLAGQNALLANGNARANFPANTSVLFVGETQTTVRQVADGVTAR